MPVLWVFLLLLRYPYILVVGLGIQILRPLESNCKIEDLGFGCLTAPWFWVRSCLLGSSWCGTTDNSSSVVYHGCRAHVGATRMSVRDVCLRLWITNGRGGEVEKRKQITLTKWSIVHCLWTVGIGTWRRSYGISRSVVLQIGLCLVVPIVRGMVVRPLYWVPTLGLVGMSCWGDLPSRCPLLVCTVRTTECCVVEQTSSFFCARRHNCGDLVLMFLQIIQISHVCFD